MILKKALISVTLIGYGHQCKFKPSIYDFDLLKTIVSGVLSYRFDLSFALYLYISTLPGIKFFWVGCAFCLSKFFTSAIDSLKLYSLSI